MPPPYRTPAHRPTKKRRRGPADEDERSQNHLSRVGQIQRCSNCGAAGHKRRGCTKPINSAQQPKKPKEKNARRYATRSSTRGRKRASSQPPAQTSTRKKRAIASASSSQPLPREASSQPTQRPGCARGGPKFKPNPQALSKPKPAQAPSKPNSASGQPNPASAQPKPASRSTMKALSQPTKKASVQPNTASSSQPISKRAQFSVSSAHVSPQKLKLMAKLPPRKWGNL
ncbi:hypothetical protein PIB30_059901 [Stylosanthes scabra]|uniref:CCHC-type domain-containing protein n=1 Tax=Stylosanthes scabra TaxID=79078 RepID=A0ABU6QKZ6_9FABA|nr:hypothetical protein [Stylosanthes scabra]